MVCGAAIIDCRLGFRERRPVVTASMAQPHPLIRLEVVLIHHTVGVEAEQVVRRGANLD